MEERNAPEVLKMGAEKKFFTYFILWPALPHLWQWQATQEAPDSSTIKILSLMYRNHEICVSENDDSSEFVCALWDACGYSFSHPVKSAGSENSSTITGYAHCTQTVIITVRTSQRTYKLSTVIIFTDTYLVVMVYKWDEIVIVLPGTETFLL